MNVLQGSETLPLSSVLDPETLKTLRSNLAGGSDQDFTRDLSYYQDFFGASPSHQNQDVYDMFEELIRREGRQAAFQKFLGTSVTRPSSPEHRFVPMEQAARKRILREGWPLLATGAAAAPLGYAAHQRSQRRGSI